MSGAQINFLEEIIVDNFAGGGGASTGIELATGRPVTIAINHDPDAILMHKTNHPFTEHYQASVWDVDPREVSKGRPVGLAWFSPPCPADHAQQRERHGDQDHRAGEHDHKQRSGRPSNGDHAGHDPVPHRADGAGAGAGAGGSAYDH